MNKEGFGQTARMLSNFKALLEEDVTDSCKNITFLILISLFM
jgi:hypothetical protein